MCVCVCVCVCTYVYIYIYTHTHIHIGKAWTQRKLVYGHEFCPIDLTRGQKLLTQCFLLDADRTDISHIAHDLYLLSVCSDAGSSYAYKYREVPYRIYLLIRLNCVLLLIDKLDTRRPTAGVASGRGLLASGRLTCTTVMSKVTHSKINAVKCTKHWL